jgi:hypothetical protein
MNKVFIVLLECNQKSILWLLVISVIDLKSSGKHTNSFSDVHKTLPQRLATPVEEDMELKTICSALKLYLRTLNEPIFTFKLQNRFIEAASPKILFFRFLFLRHIESI